MRWLFIAFLLVSATGFSAYSQSDTARLSNIVSGLEGYSNTHPVEKVYLHLNKPEYLAGDTIWFKAYLTIGQKHQLSALSGVLYVELIGNGDRPIKSLKLKVDNGLAAGSIPLPAAFAAGTYRIMAYTNWMRNAGPDYFFEKYFRIESVKTNTLLINALYKITGSDNQGQVSAHMVYTDKQGRPFNNRQVKYNVLVDTASVLKASGTTDSKGNLTFTFPDKPVYHQKSTKIVLDVQLFSGFSVSKTVPLNLRQSNADVQFFPEGGELVTDVRSKIAFKAIGVNGLGINIKGVVLDNENKEVAFFSTQHLGMGFFAMMPQQGKTYTAKITLPDSTNITVPLPQANEKGFVLVVNSNDSLNLNVRVLTNAATLQEKQNTPFYLVGQSGGKVFYTTAEKLTGVALTATIPKNRFPSGIVQFTLFSAAGEPLNERVAFISGNDQLKIKLGTDKPVFGPREKVNMQLAANDKDGNGIPGSFSVSVINEDRVMADESTESTIQSSLLLTSDLKGYIEGPAYYFNTPSDKTRADLDVLMLTQGYRRFQWQQVLDGHVLPFTFKPEKGLSISGLLATQSGKPVVKGKISVISTLDKIAIDTISDANGRFKFPDIEFPDSTSLIVQARKANDGKNVNISLDKSGGSIIYKNNNVAEAAANQYQPVLSKADTLTKADTAQIAEIIKANRLNQRNTLKEVNIRTKKDAVAPDRYNKYGTLPSYSVNMAQAKNENSVFFAVESLVPGVVYKNGRLYYEGVAIREAIINEMYLDASRLEIIDPKDVESIAIVKTKSPVVVVTTKAYAGTDTVKVLSAVNIKAKKDAPMVPGLENSSNLNGPGNANQVITGDKFCDCTLLSQCLTSKIFNITERGGQVYSNRQIALNVGKNQMPMTFVIDGVTTNDINSIDNIVPCDIATVEVLTSNSYLAIYGSTMSSGAIIITTKRGTDQSAYAFESVPGVIYTKFSGFSKTRQFYAPKYDGAKSIFVTTDNRTAIYWKPNIITGKDGKAAIEFFNSDERGTYRAVIEGIDDNGNIGRYVYRYKVE